MTTGNVVTSGQIRVGNSSLQFGDNDNDTGNGGAQIQRVLNLAGATAVSISYSYSENSFDTGERVLVQFSANGWNRSPRSRQSMAIPETAPSTLL